MWGNGGLFGSGGFVVEGGFHGGFLFSGFSQG